MIKSNVAKKINPSIEELAQCVECGLTDRKRECSRQGSGSEQSHAGAVHEGHLGINSCPVV